MLNPYITEYPTTPEIFAGRKREINIFHNSLKYTIKSQPPSPKNIAIVGDWGVGKTSIASGKERNILAALSKGQESGCKAGPILCADRCTDARYTC